MVTENQVPVDNWKTDRLKKFLHAHSLYSVDECFNVNRKGQNKYFRILS